ncbi:MAG: hypothetical protein M1838_004060 [Thelocarpon superellum]|nr:MAG: hypothetical protein M1838_004060 [Thelocarpon superellum]
MARRAFIADLAEAVAHNALPAISGLQPGAEDGTFAFTYLPAKGDGTGVSIEAIVPDVSAYPSSHRVFLYTASGTPHPAVGKILEEVGMSSHGLSVAQLLALASTRLHASLAGGSTEDAALLSDDQGSGHPGPEGQISGEEGLPSDEEEGDDDLWFGGWSPQKSHEGDEAPHGRVKSPPGPASPGCSSAQGRRLREDLRAAKGSGFRVGLLGGAANPATDELFTTVSIRIDKLPLSDDAMHAWDLNPQHYAVLILRYPAGYKSLEQITAVDRRYMHQSVELRVGVSKGYKPSYEEATAAFLTSPTRDADCERRKTDGPVPEPGPGLTSLFIGRSLNELLNEHLLPILRIRLERGVSWSEADRLLEEMQGMSNRSASSDPPQSPETRELEPDDSLQSRSFPLLAAVFFAIHLSECTKYCLVCHRYVDTNSEALKPYVCDRPLCLYQYMTLGFGPSIEHEIVSQPNVVDLLVSLYYAHALGDRLQHLPKGLNLRVPANPPSCHPIFPPPYARSFRAQPGSTASSAGPTADATANIVRQYRVKFDRDQQELMFDAGAARSSACPVKVGDWILLDSGELIQSPLSARVMDTTAFPAVRLSKPFHSPSRPPDLGQAESGCRESSYPWLREHEAEMEKTRVVSATFTIYEGAFDTLGLDEQRESVLFLLDSLPSVAEMKAYILHRGMEAGALKTWITRISPAAFEVLRWIIASNRSSVEEVEHGKGQQVQGMAGWIQFRFAQGAPAKESRFRDALLEVTARLNLGFPTLFAWHGSPLYNWHGIIREGLHHKQALHGRTYGNGCYHSLDFATSASYSSVHSLSGALVRPTNVSRPLSLSSHAKLIVVQASARTWPPSELRAQSALSLNEIINAPDEFVSKAPHLVVDNVDWVQTRFLFVETAGFASRDAPGPSRRQKNPASARSYPQDVNYTPTGNIGQQLVIPANAFGSRRMAWIDGLRGSTTGPQQADEHSHKKLKFMDTAPGAKGALSRPTPAATSARAKTKADEDDRDSVGSTMSDLALLQADGEEEGSVAEGGMRLDDVGQDLKQAEGKVEGVEGVDKTEKRVIAFIPGTLDFKSLQILNPPASATSMATKTLQRELAAVVKLQKTQPLDELGWYLDGEAISNVYQWIVEMHSFDETLPLAQEMKQRGVKSIVLEMRFGSDYPMSPPFVRVIRPRFLPFARHGGGHVTMGGAMCMELLTNSGWSAAASIESVLLQVRMAIANIEPFPAHLDPASDHDYGIGEAVEAFVRACRAHGWEVPLGIRNFDASFSRG